MTRTAIKTIVRTAINEPTARFITETELNTWVDEAAKDISIRTFCGTVIATPIATVANCAEYSWPSVYGPGASTTPIYTLGIKTILNSNKVSLQYVPMDMLGRVGQETHVNEMKWSTWHQTIYFSPVPTAIFTMTPIIWVACHITAAGTIARLPEYAHHLLPMYCIAMAKEKRRDYEGAVREWQRYETALDRVVATISHYDTWIDGKLKPRDQAPGG